jgi:hypothetical protein
MYVELFKNLLAGRNTRHRVQTLISAAVQVSRCAEGQLRSVVPKTADRGATVVVSAAVRSAADLINGGPLIDHKNVEAVVEEGDVLDPQQPERNSPEQ